jgi:acetyl esterase
MERLVNRLVPIFLALPLLAAASGARAASYPDVEYARTDGTALQLDLEVPDGAGPYPVVVFVHGGDFTGGNRKGTNRGLVTALREAGIAWASIEYRLAPQVRFPAPVRDIESAVRFLKRRAREYRLDPERIALMGESAGVLLVSYAGAMARGESRVAAVVGVAGTHDLVRRFHPIGPCFVGGKFVPNPNPGHPQFCMPAGISAYLDITGPGEEAERRIRAASPKEHVRKEMPPYLLLHGTADVNAPFEQSIFMYDAMHAVGARCDLIVVDGGGHGMAPWDRVPEQAGYRGKLVEWLKQTLRVGDGR